MIELMSSESVFVVSGFRVCLEVEGMEDGMLLTAAAKVRFGWTFACVGVPFGRGRACRDVAVCSSVGTG